MDMTPSTNGHARFKPVVWAAVSTKAQAKADVSIPDQVRKGRAFLKERGWPEVHPPLLVPGQSRQTMVSLRDAEQIIPEMKQLLDLAQAGTVNLVVTYDYDRFRGLLDQVYRTLAMYGCQLYSVSQPVQLEPPDQFNYYTSDSQTVQIGWNQTSSHTDIARMRRKYKRGMPSRVDDQGLPYHHIPYGYGKPPGHEFNSKAVPIQVPDQCAVLLRMKREYLAGASAEQIAERLNAEGVPAPRAAKWKGGTVLKMVLNPFYAGYVHRNNSKTFADPRQARVRRKRLPQAEWVLRPGRHQPLWTQGDYERLLDIKTRRAGRMLGAGQTTHYFSFVVYCAHCQRRMVAWQPSKDSGRRQRRRYKCKVSSRAPHASIFEDELVAKFKLRLDETLPAFELAANSPDLLAQGAQVDLAVVKAKLDKNTAARARALRLAARGSMTDDELDTLQAELDVERDGLLDEEATLADLAARESRLQTIAAGARDLLERYDAIMRGDPAAANTKLQDAIEKIVVRRAAIETVIFRR